MQNSDFLKNKFDDFTGHVPEEVWNNVAATLDNKKKRRVLFWWLSGVSAAAIVVLGFGIYWFGCSERVAACAETLASQDPPSVPVQSQELEKSRKSLSTSSELNSDLHNAPNRQFQQVTDNHALGKEIGRKSVTRDNSNKSTEASQTSLDIRNIIELYAPPHLNSEALAKEGLSINLNKTDTVEAALIVEEAIRLDLQKEKGGDHDVVVQTVQPPVFPQKKWEVALIGGFFATKQQASPYFLSLGNSIAPNFESSSSSVDYFNISQSEADQSSPVIRFSLFRTGISINREMGSHWRLETGLHYLRYGVFYESSKSWSREAQMIQVPVSAHFSLIGSKFIDWRIGSGVGMSYVFRQADPVFRSEWFNNTTVVFTLQDSWSLFVQPEARMVFFDSRLPQIGKLSQWYWGVNLGVVRRF